jgi:hypothetical protein
MNKTMKKADQPLSASVEGQELVIRLGINTLAWVFDHDTENNPFVEDKEIWIQTDKIIDAREFAKDVSHEMNDEREDGSSPLTDFLEKMCRAAAENGSLGIAESGEVSEG